MKVVIEVDDLADTAEIVLASPLRADLPDMQQCERNGKEHACAGSERAQSHADEREPAASQSAIAFMDIAEGAQSQQDGRYTRKGEQPQREHAEDGAQQGLDAGSGCVHVEQPAPLDATRDLGNKSRVLVSCI